MNYLELVQARTDLALKFSSWGNAAPILRDDVPELIRRLRIAEQALDSAQELLDEICRDTPKHPSRFNGTFASYRTEFSEALSATRGEKP